MLINFFKYFIDHNYHLIIIYIVAGYVIYGIIKKIIELKTKRLKKKRQLTLQHLIKNIIRYIIIIFVLIAILNILGLNMTSILAGIGVISVIIGLALQDIMKDFLVGAFIVLEDQFDVGDYVIINGVEGIVIEFGLRSTGIKGIDDTITSISNRTITEVTNYSKKHPILYMDIPTSYEVSNKKIDKVLENIIARANKEIEEVEEEIKLLGLQDFNDSNIAYRIMIPVSIDHKFNVRRKMNRIVKEEYDKAKISIPYNIIEVKNG